MHAPQLTPRLEAALQWSLDAVLGLAWRFEPDETAFAQSQEVWKLQYGGEVPVAGVFRIQPEGLLEESHLRATPPATGQGEQDWLSFIFWMGSRMEEWTEDAPRDAVISCNCFSILDLSS